LLRENAKPTSKQANRKKQTNKWALRSISFYVMSIVIFAPLTSNISASGQNIKNLVSKLLGKGTSYLLAKISALWLQN